ncbi:hypothetical protein BDN70DRAFT_998181 [Pholiota conissans]|uniref:Heterokaryon incompatibility domain-containing protein n=1 Tax=Pholiota conissans TaxID=109636 RepID=A0A9P6CML2_9AGAR|nr:hypothetical protein BDN70DRAFT_998181 [Pholiota conissans]
MNENGIPTEKTPALVLLNALQNFVISVTQMADPLRRSYNEGSTLELEAEPLIASLQEFVSTIVRSCQPVAPRLNEENNTLAVPLNDDHDNDKELSTILPSVSFGVMVQNMQHYCHISTPLDKKFLVFRDNVSRLLKERVFNAMPIRLLYFVQHGSGLEITLLERESVYTHLESILQQAIIREGYVVNSELDDQAIERLVSTYTRYAILSHTWLRSAPGEVTYGDWNKGRLNVNGPGYQKLVSFCKTVFKDYGLTFGWMDTICINKESSSELDESIRSMYNWYARSSLCIAYLAETGILVNMHNDPWFTRGWTLQELLAPTFIKFYNCDWEKFIEGMDNDKMEPKIVIKVERATNITEDELLNIHEATISRRMQLAAARQVTREEDTAYSLMGIFHVSITTAYGEGGKRAFFRLLQEILITSFDALDLLNWAGPSLEYDSRVHPSGRLPSSPRSFLQRSTNSYLSMGMPIEPLVLTHLGLRIPVLLMPALSTSASSCRSYQPIGDFSATVDIEPIESHHFPSVYDLLDKQISNTDGPHPAIADLYQISLAVINFSPAVGDVEPGSLFIPETCMGIPILCKEKIEKVGAGWDFPIYNIETHKPVVFHLKTNGDEHSRVVHRDKLKEHGIQLLVNLYM